MTQNTNLHDNLLDPLEMPGSVATRPLYNPLKDPIWSVGLVLFLISFLAFAAGEPYVTDVFFLNYGITVVYMIVLWVSKRIRWWVFGARVEHYPTMLIFLLIWLVSCFSLNREMQIFQPSTQWLDIALCISGLSFIAYAWKDYLNTAFKSVLYFCLAAGSVLFVYYAVVLIPVSAVGLLFCWFFGLTLHAWVPVAIVFYTGDILKKAMWEARSFRLSAWAGMATPVVILVFYVISRNQMTYAVDRAKRDWNATDHSLPQWVAVSQHISKDPLTERLLKEAGEGTLPSGGFGVNFWGGGNRSRLNDPAIQISALFSPSLNLAGTDCSKMYGSLFDGRHDMEERLWNGDDLITDEVHTRATIDIRRRLSYTEKQIKVVKPESGKWDRSEEAIYTFYLPQGAVVTNMSLWIDGHEIPASLTSKSKAKTAYTTIVGVERRDPAVVYWREGNAVAIKVFPVTSSNPRQFKIGVTAPLRLENEVLVYDNITFEGPSALRAIEHDTIEVSGVSKDALDATPAFFKQNELHTGTTYNGIYRHAWRIDLKPAPLSHAQITFGGKTYRVQEYQEQTETFQPKAIYLDVNAFWTAGEWNVVRKIARNFPCYLYNDDSFELLTDKNAADLFEAAHEKRFSLFPFYKLPDYQQDLVITKSAFPTPTLADLGDSEFAKQSYTLNGRYIRVFHLGTNDHSAFLRSLEESRAIYCKNGDPVGLQRLLQNSTFLKNPEDGDHILIPSANMLIYAAEAGVQTEKSPNQLFQLFAYNHILRAFGTGAGESDEMLELAQTAHVVTPNSSLITLETQEDYEKFEIDPPKNVNMLSKLSKQNSGSVPEPHEWALIGLLLLATFFLV